MRTPVLCRDRRVPLYVRTCIASCIRRYNYLFTSFDFPFFGALIGYMCNSKNTQAQTPPFSFKQKNCPPFCFFFFLFFFLSALCTRTIPPHPPPPPPPPHLPSCFASSFLPAAFFAASSAARRRSFRFKSACVFRFTLTALPLPTPQIPIRTQSSLTQIPTQPLPLTHFGTNRASPSSSSSSPSGPSSPSSPPPASKKYLCIPTPPHHFNLLLLLSGAAGARATHILLLHLIERGGYSELGGFRLQLFQIFLPKLEGHRLPQGILQPQKPPTLTPGSL